MTQTFWKQLEDKLDVSGDIEELELKSEEIEEDKVRRQEQLVGPSIEDDVNEDVLEEEEEGDEESVKADEEEMDEDSISSLDVEDMVEENDELIDEEEL